METVKREIELPKEAQEFSEAVVGLVNASKKALADGFQPTDVAQIVQSEFSRLMAGVQGMEKLGSDIKEDPGMHAKCAGLMAGELTAVFLEKPAAPQA